MTLALVMNFKHIKMNLRHKLRGLLSLPLLAAATWTRLLSVAPSVTEFFSVVAGASPVAYLSVVTNPASAACPVAIKRGLESEGSQTINYSVVFLEQIIHHVHNYTGT